ncbi:MAG: hypothetical protein JXL97_12195 [Bacteroidales bacterium]|nr:hypothetical protein [Bacteroidales bacterium]
MYNLYINELSENEIIIFSGVYDFNENSVIKNIKETSVRIAYFPDTFNVHYWDFSSDIIFDNLQKPIYVYPYCGRIIAKTQRISKDEIYDIIILKNVRFKYNNKKIIFNNTFYFPSDTACLNAGIKIDE